MANLFDKIRKKLFSQDYSKGGDPHDEKYWEYMKTSTPAGDYEQMRTNYCGEADKYDSLLNGKPLSPKQQAHLKYMRDNYADICNKIK